MTLLLDTSLWIDFPRARIPAPLKQFIAPFVLDPEAHLAEPVLFEVLRSARPEEASLLEAQFATLPTLPTWRHGAQPRSAGGRRGLAPQRRSGELRRRLRGDHLGERAAPEAPRPPCLTL